MRAIVQEGYGSADVLALREIDKPTVAEDGVLVRVHAASVNAYDANFVYAPRAARPFFGRRRPRIPVRGVDIAGVVESVGKTVTRFKPGDEVFGVAPGGFAEYACTRESRLVAKSPHLTFQQVAALPVAGVTALQGIRDAARVKPGQRVLVHGAGGGVGSFAMQVAKAFGAHVTALTSTRKMDVIRSLGPDRVFDYTRDDFADQRERFDVYFDVSGTRSVRDCLRVLGPKGTLVVAGGRIDSFGAILGRLLAALVTKPFTSRRIAIYLARARPNDLALLQELVESGKITPAIDREYALHEVPEAIRYVKAGQACGKVVIDVS